MNQWLDVRPRPDVGLRPQDPFPSAAPQGRRAAPPTRRLGPAEPAEPPPSYREVASQVEADRAPRPAETQDRPPAPEPDGTQDQASPPDEQSSRTEDPQGQTSRESEAKPPEAGEIAESPVPAPPQDVVPTGQPAAPEVLTAFAGEPAAEPRQETSAAPMAVQPLEQNVAGNVPGGGIAPPADQDQAVMPAQTDLPAPEPTERRPVAAAAEPPKAPDVTKSAERPQEPTPVEAPLRPEAKSVSQEPAGLPATTPRGAPQVAPAATPLSLDAGPPGLMDLDARSGGDAHDRQPDPQAQMGLGQVSPRSEPTAAATPPTQAAPVGEWLESADTLEARQESIDRVARTMRLGFQQGAQHVRMQLHPPELGVLRVNLTMVGQQLTADLHVQTEAARSLLVQNLHVLEQNLAGHGIEVRQFQVQMTPKDAEADWQGQLPQGSDTPQDAGGEAGRQPGREEARTTGADVEVEELSAATGATARDLVLNVVA